MPRSDRSVTIDKGACACGGDIVRRQVGRRKTQCAVCEVKARNKREAARMKRKHQARKQEASP